MLQLVVRNNVIFLNEKVSASRQSISLTFTHRESLVNVAHVAAFRGELKLIKLLENTVSYPVIVLSNGPDFYLDTL